MDEKAIEEFINLSDEIEKKEFLLSELARIAKDRFGETEIEVIRNENKVRVKQKHLWEEVYQLGLDCDAAKDLREKHKNVFEAQDELNSLLEKRRKHSLLNLGFDPVQMTPTSLIKLVRELIKIEFKKYADNQNV